MMIINCTKDILSKTKPISTKYCYLPF